MNKLKKFIRVLETSVATASFLIFLLMIITKVLGFIKLRAIAQFFGVSKELDVFWAAFAIPDLIFTLLIAGTVNAALVPIFIKVKTKEGHKKVLEVLNSVVNFNIVLWFAIWAILYVLSPVVVKGLFSLASKPWVPMFFKGTIYYDKEYIDLFIKMTRMLFFSPFLLGISSIFTAFLNSYKRFTIASLAPLMYNVGIVLSVYVLMAIVPNWGVWILVISVIVGSIFHLLVQLPLIFELGYRFKPVFRFTKYVKDMIVLSVPRILGLAVEQIAITFDTFWSLFLGAGALSIFKYASSLQIMPVHLFGNSILQATFPSLNEHVAKNGKGEKFVNMFLKILVYLVWILGFTATLVIVLKIPIVKLALGTGKFTEKEVLRTALTLAGFAGAIVFYGVSALIIRAFYALHQTKKPFLISLVGVSANIIFAIIFSNLFSHSEFINYIKDLWASRLTHIYFPFSLSQIGQMIATKAYNPLSVVGLAIGVSLALGVEVLFSMFVLNSEVKLFKSALKNKWFHKQLVSVVVGNILVFIIGWFVYEFLKQHLVYSVTAMLIEIIVVSAVTGLVYLFTTWHLSKTVIKKILRK